MRRLSHCFVPGCKSGYPSTCIRNKALGLRNKSLFKAKTDAQVKQWGSIINRKDRMFSHKDVVCELHFNQQDILWYFETKMPDGIVDRMERDCPKLRSGALPTMFSNLPGYPTKVRRNRKPTKEGNPALPMKRKRKTLPTSSDKSTAVFDGVERLSMLTEVVGGITECDVTEGSDEADVVDEVGWGITPSVFTEGRYGSGVFDLTTLAESVKSIKLPSRNWSTTLVGRNVVFLCFGSNFLPEKTLVVSEDLSIKVILKRKEVSIDGIKAIKNMEDLIKVIGFLDVLQVCDGASDDESSMGDVL